MSLFWPPPPRDQQLARGFFWFGWSMLIFSALIFALSILGFLYAFGVVS